MNHLTQTYTGNDQQKRIVEELCRVHSLDPSQVSFEGDSDTPIFDYEAISTLSLRLTDIKDLDCGITDRNVVQMEIGDFTGTRITATCRVTLPDGRSRSVEATATVGEILAPGLQIATVADAEGVAQNRAARRGIRSVGVNLWRAHQAFMRNGERAAGTTDNDPRAPAYREIHVLAEKLDLIVDGDRKAFDHYLAEMFDGVTSKTDLNDIQLQQLITSLRAMASVLSRSNQRAA